MDNLERTELGNQEFMRYLSENNRHYIRLQEQRITETVLQQFLTVENQPEGAEIAEEDLS